MPSLSMLLEWKKQTLLIQLFLSSSATQVAFFWSGAAFGAWVPKPVHHLNKASSITLVIVTGGTKFPDTDVCEEDWFSEDEFSANSKEVPLIGI